jgi:hypothetical protein
VPVVAAGQPLGHENDVAYAAVILPTELVVRESACRSVRCA